MRPIDADALEPKFVHGRWDDTYVSETELMNAPTLDVVIRKHGEWNEITDRTMDCCYRCSECGFIRDAYFLEVTNFCPNCGADMRGETSE